MPLVFSTQCVLSRECSWSFLKPHSVTIMGGNSYYKSHAFFLKFLFWEGDKKENTEQLELERDFAVALHLKMQLYDL